MKNNLIANYKGKSHTSKVLLEGTSTKPSRIAIRYRNHEGDITKYLEALKVSYIEAYGSSVIFYLTDGSTILSGKNLGFYEESIVSRFHFIKIGRSYIVNPAEIDSFNNSEGYLHLKTPLRANASPAYKLRVSRVARQELLQAIQAL